MSDSATDPYTKIPNALLDAMGKLGNAELRVLLAITRKTTGWGKACDVISLTQLGTMTGLARRHIIKALASIEEQGWIAKEPAKRNGFCYRLVPLGNQSPKVTSTPREPELVPLGNQSLVPLGYTQKKDSKEKERKGESARKRATPPPTLDFAHEGVVIWKRLTGKRAMTPTVARLIAEKVTDAAGWERAVSAWLHAGYNPNNVSGMVDWYEHPEKITRPGSNGRSAPEPARPVIPATPSSIAPDARTPEETARRARELMAARKAGRS